MSRTRKQPYRKSRAFDATCRCHGGCPWCEENRGHATRRRELSADEQLNEIEGADPVASSRTPEGD